MPPSRKEGPPQASPTSLASSSSAASPSRGKEPPQVDRHICMNSCAVPWTTQWHKKQNIWMVIADIYDEQCRTSVLLGCQHMLYSAVMLGSIVRLGVIMLYIQHPTHWGLAADIPQHCSGPICPQSYFHSLLFCVLLFAILLPWLASSFTVKLFFSPPFIFISKSSVCFFFGCFLLYVLGLVYFLLQLYSLMLLWSSRGRSPALRVWSQGPPCLKSPTLQDQADLHSSDLSLASLVLTLVRTSCVLAFIPGRTHHPSRYC